MLRVAHIVRRFAFEEWGGTESVVWNIVKTQRAMGLEADILATSALSSAGTGRELRDGVPIIRFPYSYPYFPMNDDLRKVLDKKGGNPWCPQLFQAVKDGHYDIMHVHACGRLAQMAIALARKMDIRCLLSLHGGSADVPKEELQRMMQPTKGKFNYGGIIDRILRIRKDPIPMMDAVICIGRQEERLLNQKYPKANVVYLPNGIDLPKFNQPAVTAPRREWNIPQDRTLLLCISRIDYQKNQKALVSLLAKTENTHLLLIGPITSEWYRDEIVNEVKRLKLEDRFTLIPGLQNSDPRLVDSMHEADVFILPSVHEPFGIVALEAWAAGLPLIASDAGGLKDFIRNEENGLLFPSGDDNALFAAYQKLQNASLRNAIVAKASEDVKNYSWQNITQRLVDLYQNLNRP